VGGGCTRCHLRPRLSARKQRLTFVPPTKRYSRCQGCLDQARGLGLTDCLPVSAHSQFETGVNMVNAQQSAWHQLIISNDVVRRIAVQRPTDLTVSPFVFSGGRNE
jgi:hypothetical protein